MSLLKALILKSSHILAGFFVPIINRSNYNLHNQQQLKLGLDYCFVDKNKDVQRFLAANMKFLVDRIRGNIDHKI